MKSQTKLFESLLPLIDILSDGEFHSGEDLAHEFALSRMAIHKKIIQLQAFGLAIESKKKVGYRFKNKIQRLNESEIKSRLMPEQAQKLAIFPIIDSTNQALLEQLGQIEKGQIYLAEMQTQGRGRQGRSWFSPFGCNLYYSMYWRFDKGFQALSGFSLAVGIHLATLLTQLTKQPIKVKWPNDLYLNHKKIGGILIELSSKMGDPADVIIGFGLNLNMPKRIDNPIDQPYDSLLFQDKNQLVQQLIPAFYTFLTQFENDGFVQFYEQWQAVDLYFNQPIQFLDGNRLYSGIERGINAQGELLIEDEQGNLHSYLSGDIQLQKPNVE